jgi:glycosyltransferase involved in cell wall biosynthesis
MEVSILMITYNHERYIAHALESILSQHVGFEYEIVIGEDCSKDNTRKIILEYREKYPGKIRLLSRETNIGMLRNYARTFKECKGKYIAVLDGDDYWISLDKLQKQVDYLERHPECSICFHNVNILYEDSGEVVVMKPPHRKEKYVLEDLLDTNFIANSSVLYRAGIIDDFPAWWYSVEMTDWTTHIMHAQQGEAGYLDETMAVYRVHSKGVWSMQSNIEKILEDIKAYRLINKHLEYRYNKKIKKLISNCYYKLSLLSYDKGDMKAAKNFSTRCFIVFPFNRQISRSVQLKALLKFNALWLYESIKKTTLGLRQILLYP